MKTAQIFSAFFISSTLLLAACTPKDEAVTDAKTRERILEQKNRRNGGGSSRTGQKVSFRFGSYAISSLQTELAVEALEVLRLSLGYADATNTVYTKSADVLSEDKKSFKSSLSADKVKVLYTNTLGNFDSVLAKKWDVEVVTAGDEPVSVLATAKDSMKSTDQKNAAKKTFVNFRESLVTLKAEKLPNNLLQVSVTGKGSMNARVQDVPGNQTFEYSLQFKVDISELKEGKVKLQAASSKYEDIRSNGKNWTVTVDPSELQVNLDGRCNEVVGTVTMGGKKPKKMEFSKDGVEVAESSFKASYGACGHRPTVDLSRLILP